MLGLVFGKGQVYFCLHRWARCLPLRFLPAGVFSPLRRGLHGGFTMICTLVGNGFPGLRFAEMPSHQTCVSRGPTVKQRTSKEEFRSLAPVPGIRSPASPEKNPVTWSRLIALAVWLLVLTGRPGTGTAQETATPVNGFTVYNKGVGGQNTEQGRARFARDVVQLKPDFVFIYFGLNDALNEPKFVPLDRFTENLKWMVNEARAHHIKPVLCTIHHVLEEPLLKRHKRESYGDEGPNGKIDRYNAAVRSLATSQSVPLADFAKAVAQARRTEPNVISPDGVHLTPAGNRLLAQTFAAVATPRLTGKEVIVCLGDSVTYGAGSKHAGTAEGDTYPGMLRRLQPRSTSKQSE